MVANNCNYGNSLNPTQLFNEAPAKWQQERENASETAKIKKGVNYIPLDKCSFCLRGDVKKQRRC